MADNKHTEDMGDDELDQIIQDMSKEDEAQAPVEAAVAAGSSASSPTPSLSVVPSESPRTAKAETTAAPGQSLALELTGVVNLKLRFASGDRSIELTCTEEALVCRMADGTEFRLPTGVSAKRKAA